MKKSDNALLNSFIYAINGVIYLLKTQRNAKIHCVAAAIVTGMGLYLGITKHEWLSLIIMISLVISLEGVNTALEVLTDLVSQDHHPLAGACKDVAAGAVLIAAGASIIVGLIIFLPYLA